MKTIKTLLCIIWWTIIPTSVHGFTPSSLLLSPIVTPTTTTTTTTIKTKTKAKTQLKSSSSTTTTTPINKEEQTIFPVLSKISGVEWNGQCRYVNEDLYHLSNLKLVGGVRYDIHDRTCTLSSFLTFPNGQTREVVMQGIRDDSSSSSSSKDQQLSLRLDSTAENGGPIYMKLTELEPDTILINEVEKASGKIIMTSSISIVNEGRELVQVSHEVGEEGKMTIEGHQVWRLKQVPIEYDDFAARDTTGR